ncbi:hypothetical protein F5Y16DRAFT_33279 [Xylariaceae sp. FL0255]|nr:hypothetical protein F5Y16DRAFT_33279 [Xylariaceae sp. FL0255]
MFLKAIRGFKPTTMTLVLIFSFLRAVGLTVVPVRSGNPNFAQRAVPQVFFPSLYCRTRDKKRTGVMLIATRATRKCLLRDPLSLFLVHARGKNISILEFTGH